MDLVFLADKPRLFGEELLRISIK